MAQRSVLVDHNRNLNPSQNIGRVRKQIVWHRTIAQRYRKHHNALSLFFTSIRPALTRGNHHPPTSYPLGIGLGPLSGIPPLLGCGGGPAFSGCGPAGACPRVCIQRVSSAQHGWPDLFPPESTHVALAWEATQWRLARRGHVPRWLSGRRGTELVACAREISVRVGLTCAGDVVHAAVRVEAAFAVGTGLERAGVEAAGVKVLLNEEVIELRAALVEEVVGGWFELRNIAFIKRMVEVKVALFKTVSCVGRYGSDCG